jgi:hypothetical protein
VKYDGGFTAKPPQFRSALEQVSWMTNSKLREEEVKNHTGKPSNFKLGVFGLWVLAPVLAAGFGC